MFERAKELTERLFRRDSRRRQAHELYVDIADAARRPWFYEDSVGVADDPEGRYEMLTLHVAMVLRRLKEERDETAKFAQLLFDVMFRDVDDTLRELGVGDMKVGKKVREHAEAFFGRTMAYDRALAGEESLQDALSRNVFGAHDAPGAAPLARYTEALASTLAAQPVSALMDGHLTVPDVPMEEDPS